MEKQEQEQQRRKEKGKSGESETARGSEPEKQKEQEALEACGRASAEEAATIHKEQVNGMMAPEFVSCDAAEHSLTMRFEVLPWEKNRVGVLHGGVWAASFDYTMGTLARFYAGSSFCPTVSLDIKYIRPVPLGQRFLVRAKATARGKRIIQLTAEAFSEETGKLAATAAAVFMTS